MSVINVDSYKFQQLRQEDRLHFLAWDKTKHAQMELGTYRVTEHDGEVNFAVVTRNEIGIAEVKWYSQEEYQELEDEEVHVVILRRQMEWEPEDN